MKKVIKVLAIVAILSTLASCQTASRNFGGSSTVELPENEKLVNITWKENSLWYLTKPMTEEDVAETYKFQESSNLGILEGTVTVIEIKGEIDE